MKFKCTCLTGHLQLVTAVALSAEGKNACSASADGSCRVWRVDDATCYFVFDGEKRVSCCDFSADGRMIITGDWGYQTRVWDAVVGQLVMSLGGHQGKLTASRFRSDGNLMLTASEDKNVRTWDSRRGVSVAFAAPDEVLDCAFFPDTTSILGACKNGMVLVWDVRKPEQARLELEAHGTDWVTCCSLSPSGDKALTSSTDRTMKMWNIVTGEHLKTFEGHQESINGCRFLGDYVVSGAGNRFWGSKDNTVVVWDPNTGQSFRTLKGHSDAVMCIDTCCHDGKMMIAAASMDKTVRVWNCVSPASKKKDESTGAGPSVDCKFGCGIRLSTDRLAQHETICPIRIVQCPWCGKDLPARELEAHNSECLEGEFACVCGAKLRNKHRKRHESDECPMREVECKLGCGMMMKISSLDAHMKTFCQERMVKCRMGCGATVVARNLVTHQQNGCQCRDVVCELCGASFVAKDAEQHKRRYCPMRQVQCRLGCNVKFPAQDTQAHELQSCSMRLVECSKGCGESIAAKFQVSHESSCRGPKVVASKRPPPLSTCGDLSPDGTSPASSRGSPLLPEIESPGQRHSNSNNFNSPRRGGSPDRGKIKCSACGHSERHCSSCSTSFCSRCLVRSGLPKSTPPLCATCSRENNVRARELLARGGPSPMRFGGGGAKGALISKAKEMLKE